mmetsp:Transcript_12762/g.33771  ORF Transcript_12762/g.33771 Transcript_12762/m.33771 type:complete len:223 (+) Transcript_12762:2488-3156(+)
MFFSLHCCFTHQKGRRSSERVQRVNEKGASRKEKDYKKGERGKVSRLGVCCTFLSGLSLLLLCFSTLLFLSLCYLPYFSTFPLFLSYCLFFSACCIPVAVCMTSFSLFPSPHGEDLFQTESSSIIFLSPLFLFVSLQCMLYTEFLLAYPSYFAFPSRIQTSNERKNLLTSKIIRHRFYLASFVFFSFVFSLFFFFLLFAIVGILFNLPIFVFCQVLRKTEVQ